MSPTKYGRGVRGSASPTKSPNKKGSPINSLSRIVEVMMDKICPNDLAQCEGLGADNMSCMIIQLNTNSNTTEETSSTSHLEQRL